MAKFYDPYNDEIINAGGEQSYEAVQREQWLKNELMQAEIGVLEATAIGAGREMTRLGRGIEDLALDAADLVTFDDSALGRSIATEQTRLENVEREERELMRPLQEARPYSTGAGGMLPYLATAPVAPATWGGVATMGAVEGFAGYEPSYKGRLINSALGTAGGTVGHGAGRMANRVADMVKQYKPAPKGAPRARGDIKSDAEVIERYKQASMSKDMDGAKKAVDDMIEDTPIFTTNQQAADLDYLKNTGYKITPGQSTGNKAVRNLENRLASHSYTAKPFLDIKDHNQGVFNSVVAESIGLPKSVKSLTPDKMGWAVDNFQQQFKRAAKDGNALQFSTDEIAGLKMLSEEGIESIIPNTKLQTIAGRIADLAENKGISADVYVKQRGALTKMTKDATKGAGKSIELEPLQEIISLLDDAFTRTNPNKLDALNKTREQYRIYKTLMKGNGLRLDGDINYRTFSGNMKREFAPQLREQRFIDGMQDKTQGLFNSVRSLERVQDVIPTSGTSERLSMSDMAPSNIVMEMGGNLASKAVIAGGGTKAGQAVASIPLKQIFNVEPTGAGLLEAYAASMGIGASH